jgi:hypothetical protein
MRKSGEWRYTYPAIEGISILAELPRLWIREHVFIRKPCAPHGISAGFGLVFVPEDKSARFTSHAVATDDYVALDFRPVVELNACTVCVLPVLLDTVAQMDLDADALRVLEHNLVELAAVSVEHGAGFVARRILLVDDDLACVVFVDVEAVLLQVDGDFAHRGRDGAVGPAREDAAGVGAEGYDVAEDLEGGEGFVDYGCVALSDAFYACCEAAEAWRELSGW